MKYNLIYNYEIQYHLKILWNQKALSLQTENVLVGLGLSIGMLLPCIYRTGNLIATISE